MFGMTVRITNEVEAVRKAGREAARQSFSRTAFLIRQSAVQSVEKAEGPSSPGSPPHTHRRMFLRRAIRYQADKEGAVIGPQFSMFGIAAQAHEFGGEFRGGQYPKRPFMGPALDKNLANFAGSFAGSISR